MKINRISRTIHYIVAIGASLGGVAALINPKAPLGMSYENLHGIFDNFLIPGLFLLIVIGFGNFLAALTLKNNSILGNYLSLILGFIMVLWIIIQCLILKSIVILHIIFLIIGFIQLFLNLVILKREVLFPFNVLSDYF
ncbi:hypothetical protein LJB88_01570 [Erysipelotrichaceae bacterium OttesenSCG-928-M19]|nr:hypothetical protein [Erysipelotrichaceae bacterium OttesenSCG-928-M19]